jgi:hypothetical protein
MIVNTKAASGGEGGAEAEDPQFTQAVQMIKSISNPAQLEQLVGMVSMQLDRASDPKEKAQIEKLIKIANDRLAELKAAAGK